MSTDRPQLLDTVIDALQSVAPEVEASSLSPARPLRNQVDLDSMDWLNVLIALHERTGVQIPEADYARLYTLNDLVDYLLARM